MLEKLSLTNSRMNANSRKRRQSEKMCPECVFKIPQNLFGQSAQSAKKFVKRWKRAVLNLRSPLLKSKTYWNSFIQHYFNFSSSFNLKKGMSEIEFNSESYYNICVFLFIRRFGNIKAETFYNVNYGSSIIMSKSSSKISVIQTNTCVFVVFKTKH